MTVTSDATGRLLRSRPRTASHYVPVLVALVDVMLLVAVTALAVLCRERLSLLEGSVQVNLGSVVAPMIVLGWAACLTAFGCYQIGVLGQGTEEYRRVLNASLVAASVVGVGCYLAQEELSRGFFILLFGIGTPTLVLGRVAARRALYAARRRGALRQRVLVIGSVSRIDEVANVLRRERWLGYDISGALTPRDDRAPETPGGVPVLGDAENASSLVSGGDVDVVFFAGGADERAADVRKVVWDLEHDDVQVVIAPSVSDISAERVNVRPVGGLPLMHIEAPRWIAASRWGKRVFDILGSLAVIVALAPVLVCVAAWVRLHDGGPVLFRQTRTGRRGREFGCYKFRTMVVDAEDRLPELQSDAGYAGVGLFKVRDDPRVTGPGTLLRPFSLDELPQLFNVLRGDMSLVGPRPPLPSEVARYEEETFRRLHVRPGMTGLWQVSGRSDLSWEEAVRLDLYYVDNWSMIQDLTILVRTVRAVLGRRGAY